MIKEIWGDSKCEWKGNSGCGGKERSRASWPGVECLFDITLCCRYVGY